MTLLRRRLSLAILLALVLTILPLPDWFMGIRPAWVLLLVLYVQFYLSEFFSLVVLIALGLILDVLLATVLGEHVLALTLVCWIANSKVRRFYFFSMSQQMMLVGFLSLFYYAVLFMVGAFVGLPSILLSFVGSTLLNIILWPWVRLVGEDLLLRKIGNHSVLTRL